MSESDLIPVDTTISVPAPLSLRYLEWPGRSVLSVIVEGPLGAVELQVRPTLLSFPGGGMSVEYHSRQPIYGGDTALSDCPVLGGDCYPDGGSGGVQALFEPLIRAGDAEEIVAELARRYNGHWATDYTAADSEPSAVSGTAAGELPAGGQTATPWDD